jgi:hypothetical protein
MVQVSATSRRLVHRSGFRASIPSQTQQSRPEAALCRLSSIRQSQQRAKAGKILVAATAEIAGVVMV